MHIPASSANVPPIHGLAWLFAKATRLQELAVPKKISGSARIHLPAKIHLDWRPLMAGVSSLLDFRLWPFENGAVLSALLLLRWAE